MWKEKGITLQQECRWPAEHSIIRITEGKARFAMKLRVPYWATEGFDVKLNGQSIATEYQPSSYVEISARRWKQGDVVEVIMPFSKHIHYGPDKMKTAATAPGETNTAFPSAWVGTLMYGPLAMATTGITNWMESNIYINSHLERIKANGPTTEEGTHGNLYTLTLGDLTFVPDYYADRNSTHYLRIHLTDDKHKYDSLQLVDKQPLKELIQMAEDRKQAQEAWLALEVKVPEYAPWASRGYGNLMNALATAKQVYESATATTDEVSTVTASLNAAINTMRPGNLAELEELEPLIALLKDARKKAAARPVPTLTSAIDYANMVMEYVSNGSGTRDMITTACERLKKEMKE